MQAVFNTESSGSVTLPGSEPKAVSRFVYEDHRKRLNNTFEVMWVNVSDWSHPIKQIAMSFRVQGNELMASYVDPTYGDRCYFKGNLTSDGVGFISIGGETCDTTTGAPLTRYDRIENLKVDELGILTGTLSASYNLDDPSKKTTLLGKCVEHWDVIVGPGQTMDTCSPSQLGLTASPE
jgi:hypothetical protein